MTLEQIYTALEELDVRGISDDELREYFSVINNAFLEAIAEINDRYSRCKPINKIYMCDVRGPEIFINGPRNYTCTISFNNVTGDLIL